MCNNKITQFVPTRFDYKAVEGKCGQTGQYGKVIFCQECIDKGAARREQKRADRQHYLESWLDY